MLPEETHPEYLLETLASQIDGLHLMLGVQASNTTASGLLQSLGLLEHPSPPWRMLLGRDSAVGLSDRLYAIGTAAKG